MRFSKITRVYFTFHRLELNVKLFDLYQCAVHAKILSSICTTHAKLIWSKVRSRLTGYANARMRKIEEKIKYAEC